MKWSGLRLDQKVFIPEKTKNGDAPLMPIPDSMIPWFEKMAALNGTFGFICPGIKPGKPRTHTYTTRYIKRALKAAGLSDRITNHRLWKLQPSAILVHCFIQTSHDYLTLEVNYL